MDFREKLESETKALMEANLQLEQKQHRVQHLEAAQRLAQKTSSDEVCVNAVNFSDIYCRNAGE